MNMKKNYSCTALMFSALLLLPLSARAQRHINRNARVAKAAELQNQRQQFWLDHPAFPRMATPETTRLKTPPTTFAATTTGDTRVVTVDDGTVLEGNIIYASNMTSTSGISFYKFPVTTGNATFTNITGGKSFRANGGGIYSEDRSRYDLVEWVRGNTGTVSAQYARLNTSDWSVERTQVLPQNDYSMIAYDVTRDPVTHQVYGAFINSAGTGMELGVADYDKVSRTTIGALSKIVVALAADSKGQLWGIATDGNLYKINKQTAAMTLVGSLGVTVSSNLQSMTFYQKKNVLYFSQFSQGASGLYQVNTTTGAATKVMSYPKNEELVALNVLQEGFFDGVPAAPTNVTCNFTSKDKTAQVGFSVPQKTYQGAELTGKVAWHIVTSDGQDITDSARAGYNISQNVQFKNSGKCSVYVYLSNAAGDGPRSEVFSQWLGYDVPVAVTNVHLKVANNQNATLTWTAPAKGVNGGQLDAGEMSYSITRMPDGKAFTVDHDTVLSDTIHATRPNIYYYTVAPVIDGLKGAATESNHVRIDKGACSVPFVDNFGSQDDFDLFDVQDRDSDGVTWQWYDMMHTARIAWSSSAHNDWLISPAIHLEPGNYYRISYDVNRMSSQQTEKMRAVWGDAGASADTYTNVLAEGEIENWQSRTVSKIVTVDKAQDVRLAFQALSDANQGCIYLRNVKVELETSFQAPAKATITAVKAAARGGKSATISFTAPTTTTHGEALSSISAIKVYNGDEVAWTAASAAPGQSYTAEVPAQGNGIVNLRVECANEHGATSVDTTVYVGIDRPQAPRDIHLSDNGSTVQLSWDAPAGQGINGGYVDPAALTYNVGSSEGSTLVAQQTTATSYSAPSDTTGTQRMLYYGVQAVSEAGEGQWGLSNFVLAGKAYELPFTESFPGQTPSHDIWIINDQDAVVASTLAQDGDEGAMVLQSATDSVITLQSGKIDVSKAASPVLSFWYYQHKSGSKLNVLVAKDGGTPAKLTNISFESADTTVDRWQKVLLPLADYRQSHYITLTFEVLNDKQSQTIFDNILIDDRYAHNLSVSNLNCPATVSAGSAADVVATVENKGYADWNDAHVALRVNGNTVADSVVTLKAGQEQNVTFHVTFNAGMTATADSLTHLEVLADETGDDDPADNSRQASVNVSTLNLPTVTDLTGHAVGDALTLTWSRPNYTAPLSVTDDMESYDSWSLDSFGNWTTIDENPGWPAAQPGSGSFEHMGEKYAAIVMEPESALSYSAHSGKKVLAIADNDAWAGDAGSGCENTNKYLVSPELTGQAQTITFWWSNAEEYVPEQFSVVYSTTGNAAADFTNTAWSIFETPYSRQWTEQSVDLPAGAKYFAIHVTSSYGTALLIDDITYAPANASGSAAKPANDIEGYNVYLNGVQLNQQPVTATTYTTPMVYGKYQVSTVYTRGEAALGNVYEPGHGTGISTIVTSDSPTVVYSVNGVRRPATQRGVNIIRQGNHTYKVAK